MSKRVKKVKPKSLRDTIQEMVDKAASDLGEYTDSVKIFVTWRADDGSGGTDSYESGCGNVYAQIGQVRDSVIMQEQQCKLWTEQQYK